MTSLILVVAGVLYLPRLLALESISVPDLDEIPAWINKLLVSSFEQFRKGSMEGWTLLVWPAVVLLAPRRLLGLALLMVLGSGLIIQFSALLSGDIRPATVLAYPSALDLLASGALVGAMFPGRGRSENGRLGRWAMLMGLVLGLTSMSVWFQDGLPNWGTVAVLSAPDGFGAVNFILEIVGTTLVASLVWRDLDEMIEDLRRSSAR